LVPAKIGKKSTSKVTRAQIRYQSDLTSLVPVGTSVPRCTTGQQTSNKKPNPKLGFTSNNKQTTRQQRQVVLTSLVPFGTSVPRNIIHQHGIPDR
jgi:hypothetical protein